MKKAILIVVLIGAYMYAGAQITKPKEQQKDTATQHPAPRHRHESGNKADTTKLIKEKNQGNVKTPDK